MFQKEFCERSFGRLSVVIHPEVGLRDDRKKQRCVSSKPLRIRVVPWVRYQAKGDS